MADSNFLCAEFPLSTLQMHKVQTLEPEESNSVVCRITNVCLVGTFGVAFARTTTGLGFGIAFELNGATALRGLKEASTALGRGARATCGAANAGFETSVATVG